MATKITYHAIKVDTTKCFGCTHCMKVCPTEAIRIWNGIAQIDDTRCIDCGNCLRVCPVEAFYLEQDDLSLIRKFKYRIVLIPAVLIGQFPEKYSEEQIYSALLKIGFTHAYEVEQPIKILIDEIEDFCENNKGVKPLISSFCPAVVRLIQIKYPSLVENIVLKKSPYDLAAFYVIKKLEEEGALREEIGIFYITPCSAKMAAVKVPFNEKDSIIDGIINMSEIYNQVMKVISNVEKGDSIDRRNLSSEGILWGLTCGEAKNLKRRSIAVDGIHNVVKILDRIENEKLAEIDFLELRSCDQSCAGGILLTGDRFLTVERLKKRSEFYKKAALPECGIRDIKESLNIDPVKPGPVFMFDTNRVKALEKMHKAHKIVCQLPGIDCGACGAPNCQALAEDMVMGKAKMSDCIYLQQRWQTNGKITTQKAFENLEKKWGKGRFEADCNKKGARNEGF